LLDIEKGNKLALHYALHYVERMKQITAPLRSLLGIKNFSYMRTYNDCKYLSLLDGKEEYTKKFFETIPKSDPHFIEAIQSAPPQEASFTLWPTRPKIITPILALLSDYNIWHGFQVTFRHNNYCEMFSFTFDKDSDDKSNFFIKNSNLLLEFIKFFKIEAIDLIDEKQAALASFPEKFNTAFVEDDTKNKLLEQFTQNIKIKNMEGKIISLTKKESELIKLYIKNKTCKQIALTLNINPRTVETHIYNIKQKLCINFKTELIELYYKSFF
jgi:DNA-binding CsgD family transcriptional regulator